MLLVSIAGISRFVLRDKLLVVVFWMVASGAGMVAGGPATSAPSPSLHRPGRESPGGNGAIIARYGGGGFTAPYAVTVELPTGTAVDSPGVRDGLGALFAKAAGVVPGARAASFASTGDRAFVSADGRTTFGLIYPAFG